MIMRRVAKVAAGTCRHPTSMASPSLRLVFRVTEGLTPPASRERSTHKPGDSCLVDPEVGLHFVTYQVSSRRTQSRNCSFPPRLAQSESTVSLLEMPPRGR